MTARDRHSLPAVKSGLKIVGPEMKTHTEMVQQDFTTEYTRTKYAPMRAHRELAAQVLAVGGTQRLAAARAGVSLRQIRKYLENPDFRQRIEELRTLMLSTVRGRLVAEVTRRSSPSMLKSMEILDLLRMWDRVMGPANVNKGINIAGDLNVNNQYDTFIQALLAADPSSKSEDFQTFTVDGTAVSSEDTPF